MEPDPVVAALDRLAPGARGRAPVRMRIGVGAAVLLLILALAAAVVVSAVGQQSGHRIVAPSDTGEGQSGGAERDADAGGPSDSLASPESAAIIFVHVLGAVRRPGLFELSTGARVMDAVAAAGGLTETADPSGANLARKLTDGEQLYLPQVGELPPGPPAGAGSGGGAAAGGAATLVNLNTATLADLDTLPRIGPAMAQRILDYREANGPFASVDDLRNVTGIGEKTFEGLSTLVTV
ncbi:ComEA family DNA-binding protein [Cryobacterium cryoconiti]|uniref:ComEA family DNA-binding protein n=1 Tax=Cryobacterium cryoconiti TaxID=1259239 RepID=A0A4Y8JXV9_9MICO|nr:ComEA family DNA-binding protein [Cryobacterium cryoconiti]TFD33163.1 ComEA family DNA-binding protein [Cryobacterium cryoconiti]